MQLFQRGLDSSISSYSYKELKLKPGDNLIINVYTMATNDQAQANLLNLGGIGKSTGTYLVNNNGQIDFPKIGLQQAAGLTVQELRSKLITKWSAYVKDIVVNIQLQQLTVNVLGEVRIPGNKIFNSERVTLLDALAAGGGVVDDAKRSDILIIREENGNRSVFKIDLRDASFYNSPAYQLQQNDVVIVGIADYKFQQRATTEFNQRFSTTFAVMTFFNFIIGITILISTLNK